MGLENRLEQLYPEMVAWRRHMHRYPELSYEERETSSYIVSRLQEFGLQVRRGGGGFGIVADLKGSASGATVALRADMDGLPIQDEKTNEYASLVPGVMHACGHDGHVAALLGAAKALAERREQIPGTIRFLFQPAEEVSPGGALPMIRDGALDGVDAIYGVHLWTPFPVGTAWSRAGAFMAAADEFQLEIRGRGGHGGLPHETVDSLVVGSHLVVNLQSIVSRSINPVEPSVISVGSFHAGKGFNVIAGRTQLSGTVRSFDLSVRTLLQERIEKVVADTCGMFGADFTLDYKLGYPPVANDAGESQRFFRVAGDLLGDTNVKESPLIMAGEDFSYYLQKVPGCFIFMGAGNPDASITAPHHHPMFDIDERAMLHSAKLLARLALDRLGSANF